MPTSTSGLSSITSLNLGGNNSSTSSQVRSNLSRRDYYALRVFEKVFNKLKDNSYTGEAKDVAHNSGTGSVNYKLINFREFTEIVRKELSEACAKVAAEEGVDTTTVMDKITRQQGDLQLADIARLFAEHLLGMPSRFSSTIEENVVHPGDEKYVRTFLDNLRL